MKYYGKIKYIPIREKWWWIIKIDDILVDGKSLGFCNNLLGCKGVVDTGTSIFTVPTKHFKNLFNNNKYQYNIFLIIQLRLVLLISKINRYFLIL